MSSSSPANDSTSEDTNHDRGRVHPRNNLFVVATLYSLGGPAPVRIRNMSRCGALVEGTALPTKGQEVQLVRGSLSVSGLVAWCDGGKAGLRFGSSILVADWLPGGNRVAQQLRVDQIVFNAKGITPAKARPERRRAPARAPSAVKPVSDFAAGLVQLQECVELVAKDLAGDPAVAGRFQTQLQMLGLSAQKLGELAEQATTGD